MRNLLFMADKWDKFTGKNPVSVAGLLSVNNKRDRILSLEEEKRLLSCAQE